MEDHLDAKMNEVKGLYMTYKSKSSSEKFIGYHKAQNLFMEIYKGLKELETQVKNTNLPPKYGDVEYSRLQDLKKSLSEHTSIGDLRDISQRLRDIDAALPDTATFVDGVEDDVYEDTIIEITDY